MAARSADTVPSTSGWLLRGKDGRLTAYAPVDDGVLRWTETRVGGPDWTGPERLTETGLLPYLLITQSSDGFVHLVGLRRRARDEGPDEVDLVQAVQFQSGRPLREWRSLGNPHGKDLKRGERIGLPAGAVDATGSLHLFVRNANSALSCKNQAPSGRWQAWGGVDAPGMVVTGEPAAACTDTGQIDVLVPAGDTWLRWRREDPKASLERGRTEDEPAARAVPGTITTERTGPGRLTYFWRDAGDGTVRAWRPGMRPVSLGGPGSGPIALLRTPVEGYDCTVLAQRGADGRPCVAAYPTEDETAGLNWVPTGERCVGAPALSLDGMGRVVLATIGVDGALRTARQKSEQGLALAAWTRV